MINDRVDYVPLLEICIPTYGRTSIIMENLSQMLECSDQRFQISVSSNAHDSVLQKFCQGSDRINYMSFQKNTGFTNNVKTLLGSSCSRYVLLMSDEDTIESSELINLLDFLDRNISNRIFYVPSHELYSVGNIAELGGHELNYIQTLLLAPMHPTYVSGYIYPRSAIQESALQKSFVDSLGNAYPFIVFRNNSLVLSNFQFMILKGIKLRKGRESSLGGAMHTSEKLSIHETKKRTKYFSGITLAEPFYFTSMSETEERFRFFASHLCELLSHKKVILWLSLMQIRSRMKSGVGLRVIFVRKSCSTGKQKSEISLKYELDSGVRSRITSLILDGMALALRKTLGLYRLFLRLQKLWRG